MRRWAILVVDENGRPASSRIAIRNVWGEDEIEEAKSLAAEHEGWSTVTIDWEWDQ